MSADYVKKTTKEIKAMLVKEFGHKFSVTKGTGTASHWISVNWTDGPTSDQVHKFCLQFNDTGNDDVQTDLWCGCQYTSESRTISDRWSWALVSGLDLRTTEPNFAEQVNNYYELLCHRRNQSDNVELSWNETKSSFTISADVSLEHDYLDDVIESLKLQGFVAVPNGLKTALIVTDARERPSEAAMRKSAPKETKTHAGKLPEGCLISEYKDHPIITLPNGSRNGLTFGLKKAKTIVQYIKAIEAFIANCDR